VDAFNQGSPFFDRIAKKRRRKLERYRGIAEKRKSLATEHGLGADLIDTDADFIFSRHRQYEISPLGNRTRSATSCARGAGQGSCADKAPSTSKRSSSFMREEV
jgi:hypothetical protein